MTRYLYIVRHATAEDSISFFKDFERELSAYGKAEATRMGRFLHTKGLVPDLLISSSAPRAFQTAQLLGEQLGYSKDKIQSTRDLYDGGPRSYINTVNRVPENCTHLMIIGHNPDASYFSDYLANTDIDSMVKGGVITIAFENLQWNEVSAETGKFISYDTPPNF